MQDYSTTPAFHKTPKHSIGFFYILPLGLLLGFLLFVVSYVMKGGRTDLFITQAVTPTPVAESTLPTATPTPIPSVTPTRVPASPSGALRIRVLNGSGVAGTAGKMADELTSLDYESVTTGNADKYTYEDIIIRYSADKKTAAEEVQKALQKKHSVQIERAEDLPSGVDIEIIAGKED